MRGKQREREREREREDRRKERKDVVPFIKNCQSGQIVPTFVSIL